MDFCKFIFGAGFLALLLSFGAPGVSAQDEPQGPPAETKPAARSNPFPSLDSDNGQDDSQNSTNQLQPDTSPLTGVSNFTLGSSEVRHSYWVPGIQYASNIQSSQYNQSNSPGWFVDNYIMANVSLLKAWSRSQLVLNYSGGGMFSSNSQQGNGQIQELAVAQTFQWNRLQLQLLDQFSYLPQAQFGFGGGTGLGIPGAGGVTVPTVPPVGGGTVPNQSIFASNGPRYSNTAVIQATYQMTPRTSITAASSYGILRFLDPGNVDSNSFMGSLGYNYQLTREDTLGVLYRFTNYQYPGIPQAFGDQTVNLAYGRKITGRLAFQAAGGPEFSTFRVPINHQTSKVGGNGSFNLSYAFENGSISGGFVHGLSGGSGVLTGANTNQLNFGVSRKLSRVWSGQLNFGYARNSAISSSTPSTSPSYDSWIVGGGVNRPIGRDISLALAYSANISKSAQSGCTGTSCSSSQTVNYITMTFQWHSRPLVLP